MCQLVLEKENSEFKPVKLRLKIDLVSYPARAEALVNMDTNFHVPTLEPNILYEVLFGFYIFIYASLEQIFSKIRVEYSFAIANHRKWFEKLFEIAI